MASQKDKFKTNRDCYSRVPSLLYIPYTRCQFILLTNGPTKHILFITYWKVWFKNCFWYLICINNKNKMTFKFHKLALHKKPMIRMLNPNILALIVSEVSAFIRTEVQEYIYLMGSEPLPVIYFSTSLVYPFTLQ